MCRCGGASEHEHLSGETNPSKCSEAVFREHFYPVEGTETLVSDADDQIIITVPFAGTVKVKSMEIFGSPSNPASWPAKVKVFVNAPHIDFTNVDGMSPTQEFDLSQQATDGPVQYNLKSAKFFNVNSLTLFFEKSHGSPTTEINFIGFQGEFSQNRVGAVKTTYEVKPQLSDHKTGDLFATSTKASF